MKVVNKWLPEDLSCLESLAAKGLRTKEIASLMGRSRGSVLAKCQEIGIPLSPGKPKKLSLAQQSELLGWAKAIAALGSCDKKAAALGVSKQTLWKYLRQFREEGLT